MTRELGDSALVRVQPIERMDACGEMAAACMRLSFEAGVTTGLDLHVSGDCERAYDYKCTSDYKSRKCARRVLFDLPCYSRGTSSSSVRRVTLQVHTRTTSNQLSMH